MRRFDIVGDGPKIVPPDFHATYPRLNIVQHGPTRVAFAWMRFGVMTAVLIGGPALADTRANYFDDPFFQVTNGITDCPVPEGPMITEDQMKSEAHSRAERGTRCFLSGRCRLSNSYLYDKEIIPRVKKAILSDGHFTDTSIWVEGQRRWVWLKGCVRRNTKLKRWNG